VIVKFVVKQSKSIIPLSFLV